MKLAACFLAAILSLAPARAQDDPRPALERFAGALAALRDGDSSAEVALRAAAEELCRAHGRCDARSVAEHYLGLSTEALAQGRLDEQAYVALRERVRAAGAEGLDGTEWAEEREAILAELLAHSAACEKRPDFVPAAQSLALAARIEAERAENDGTLEATSRALVARQAELHARAAQSLFARAGQSTPRLETEWVLAKLALQRGDVELARAGFEALRLRALATRRDEYREHALQGHLALARQAGDVRAEERWLTELASFRAPQESWPLARDWALRLLAEDLAEAAADFLERCAPPNDAHAADRVEWELLCGSIALRRGNLESARAHFERLGDDRSELARLARASLALRESRADDVLNELDDATLAQFSPSARARAGALVGEAALALGDFALARRELELAFDAAAISESTLRAASGAALSGSVIGERLGLHSVVLLARALDGAGEPLKAVACIESAHARSLRRDTGETLDEESVRAWAAPFELGMLTWIVGADSGIAAHVAPDGTATLAPLSLGRAPWLEAVRRLREAALDPRGDRARLDALARELATALIPAPIAGRLAALRASAGDEPRVLLLAHGPLEALPFEVLSIPALGRGAALSVLPGLPGADPGASIPSLATASWAVAGDPLDASGASLLRGAREELLALAESAANPALALGRDFTRARLAELCRSGRALHIATHLDATCDETRAFGAAALRTSEPLALCADELAAWRPALPLVVLSTCWSASGARVDAEGQLGIARSFLAGGTRSVIVTQWPVEDRAAARAAAQLHDALRAGVSPARAAARAREALRAQGASPAEWAALRAVGRD